MTDDSQADTAVKDEQRSQTQLALGAMLVPLFFVIAFAVCIIGTYHKPHPNNIKVGVVGPPALTAPLRAGFEKEAGSAFDIRPVVTVVDAAHQVRQGDLNAAFVPTANPKQPATVIVASATAVSSPPEPTLSPAPLAFIGAGALYGFIIGLGTRLLQAPVGPLAIFSSLAIFAFLNIASLGATYASPVLRGFWRFLNHFWIGARAISAQRSILYFGGQGVATDVLRLLAGAGVITALLVVPVSRKLKRAVAQRRAPANANTPWTRWQCPNREHLERVRLGD